MEIDVEDRFMELLRLDDVVSGEECLLSCPDEHRVVIEGVYKSNDVMEFLLPEDIDGMRKIVIDSAIKDLRLLNRPIHPAGGGGVIECFTSSLGRWKEWVPQLVLCGRCVVVYMHPGTRAWLELCLYPRSMYSRRHLDGSWETFSIQLLGDFTDPVYEKVDSVLDGLGVTANRGWAKCEISALGGVHKWARKLTDLGCKVDLTFSKAGILVVVTAPYEEV